MINASDNLAGGLCQHPLIGEGLNQNRHRADRQIMRVYAAARTKLGLPT